MRSDPALKDESELKGLRKCSVIKPASTPPLFSPSLPFFHSPPIYFISHVALDFLLSCSVSPLLSLSLSSLFSLLSLSSFLSLSLSLFLSLSLSLSLSLLFSHSWVLVLLIWYNTSPSVSLWLTSPLCLEDACLLRGGWLLAQRESQNMGWVIYCCWHRVTAGTGSSSSPHDRRRHMASYRRQQRCELTQAQLLFHNNSCNATSAAVCVRVSLCDFCNSLWMLQLKGIVHTK